MPKQNAVVALRVSVLLAVAWCTTLGAVQAQDVTLKDAIQCKDFKRTADGNWHATDVSLSYGPKTSQQQLNLFGSQTVRKGAPVDGIDLWTTLNDKCGTGR